MSRVIWVAVLAWSIKAVAAPATDLQASFADTQAIDILLSGMLDRELNLAAEQIDALRTLVRHRQQVVRERLNSRLEAAGLEKETKGARLLEATAEANKMIIDEIDEILLPHQIKRWRQVANQLAHRGEPTKALLVTRVSNDLRITPGQASEIRLELDRTEKAIASIVEEMRNDRDRKVRDMLTRQQLNGFNEMFGAPFHRGVGTKGHASRATSR